MSHQPQQQGAFKKDMRKIDIWALALGAIIGWGTFVMPGTNFLPKAGPSAIIGLLLGGCVMAIISLSYGYCIKSIPSPAASLSTRTRLSARSTPSPAAG